MADRILVKSLSSVITVTLLILLLSCDLDNSEKIYWGQCLANTGFLQLYRLSFSNCLLECQLRPGCSSVNYKVTSKTCEINDIGAPLGAPDCPGVTYSERTDWQEDKSEECQPSCATGMRCNDITATCERTECGSPPVVDNTIIHGNRRSIGNKLLYSCVTDTTAVFTVVCLGNGEWSPIPVCPVDCGDPSTVADSSILPGSTYEGHSRQYQCDSGYAPDPGSDVSTMTVTCQSTGNWTATNFQCIIDCGEPSPQANSNVLPGSTTIGSQRQYQCNAQYVLTPSSNASSMTVTCQAPGDWTGTDFQCVIDCQEPAAITGVDIPSGNTMFGSTRTLQCQSGYQPENSGVTSGTISCQAAGTWSSPDAAFNCLRECPEPAAKANAQIPPGPTPGVNVEDDVRTYQCESGYTPLPGNDEVEITCQNDGDWSDSNLVCVIDCGNPSSIPYSTWSGTTHEESVVTYTCDDRYSPSPDGADTTITCQVSGAWTAPSFSCGVSSIGHYCTSDSDCLEVNSRCVYNNYASSPRRRCLCNLKTEYNEATRACEIQCSSYANTFTKIPNIYINKYNIEDQRHKTEDECKQLCLDYGDACASIDYWRTEDRCYISMVTYQQIVDGDPTQIIDYNPFDTHTRDCYQG